MSIRAAGPNGHYSRPHVSNDNLYSGSQFRTLKYRPDFRTGSDAFKTAVLSVRDFFAGTTRNIVIPAWACSRQRCALWSSRKRLAATASRARCCLSTSPRALRTKRPEAALTSQRSLDQQAGSRECRSKFGPVPNKPGSCGPSELAIVVPDTRRLATGINAQKRLACCLSKSVGW